MCIVDRPTGQATSFISVLSPPPEIDPTAVFSRPITSVAAGRRFGVTSRQRVIRSFTAAGRPGGMAGPVLFTDTCSIISRSVIPFHGLCPCRREMTTQPNAQMSALDVGRPKVVESNCSGAMNAGVPPTPRDDDSVACERCERPKSEIASWSFSSTKTLAGLRSMTVIRSSCSETKPRIICRL